MSNLFQSLFGSKKFVAILCGLITLGALKIFKVAIDPSTVAEIVGLVASYVVGQGIADNGKAAAQVSAIASAQPAGTPVAKQIEAIKSV